MLHKPSVFRKMGLLPLLVFLSTLTAPAIASTIPATTQRKAQTIRWVDCHDKVPDGLGDELNATNGVFTGTIPPNLFCGEMDVPMDYTKPFDAATNNITIGFAMNRPAKRAQGLILYHAGGPGQNAALQPWAHAFNVTGGGLAINVEGLDDFDFLAVNVRGIQLSNPLNITSGVFFNNLPFAFPSTQDEFDQYQAAMKNFYAAATRDSTPPGIMNFVGSKDVVQDWDAMRAALGYEKISLAVVSYGTFPGLEYATRFPNRVDKFVLDASIPHGMPYQDMVSFQVGAANRLVQRADAFCLTDPTCPFHGQGNGSVVKAWQTVLAQGIKAPLAAPNCGPGKGCNSPVTATDLRQGVPAILRANPDFPSFNIALDASLHGDASGFAFQPQFDIRETVGSPLLCSDMKLDDDIKTFKRWNALNLASEDPLSIRYSQIWQMLLMCVSWPFGAAEHTTLPTDLEIMWMTSDFDLNLPTELTTFSWQHTPNSTLVIRHGDDHTSLPNTGLSAAAGDIARNFLRTGVMPGLRSDAQVTIIPPGGKRLPIPGVYDVPTGAIAGDESMVENIV
ncbi:alpha/beta-hydrolase [Mycena rosella]|uniref:Alpha/beta-hydrolase n=1 Tax=Mycena rosella TaxID=1033263 RepID=A0AAD7D8X3_MYCRO|nr:alpha/beta-hydrolase [Mycena rosella]